MCVLISIASERAEAPLGEAGVLDALEYVRSRNLGTAAVEKITTDSWPAQIKPAPVIGEVSVSNPMAALENPEARHLPSRRQLPLSETGYCCSNLGVNHIGYTVLEPYARAPAQHSSCL